MKCMSESAMHFAERLQAAVRRCRNPVVVGLDPRQESLPECLWNQGDKETGPPAVAEAYKRFCLGVLDVVASLVPAVKPQMAFFEQLGPAGLTVLAEVVAYARQKGLLVILDGKRGDIGTTAAAYAEGILATDRPGSWKADATTVNPYLGDDGIEPFIKVAGRCGGGVFVLVKTSNRGSGMFQDLRAEGKPLYHHVAEYVERRAKETQDSSSYGLVGAVVGATYPEQLARLRSVMPHALFLVPGYGSQGATARDVAAAFDAHGGGAIINNARGIIFAYTLKPYSERYGAANWQRAVAAATLDMIAQLRAETPAGKLA